MLILGSLSGIQEFLLDVRESGGGQARSVRYRSWRIQLIAECAGLRLLRAGGLGADRLFRCEGAVLLVGVNVLWQLGLRAVR